VIALVEKGDNWLALIGRMTLPDWLSQLVLRTKLVVISEQDLRLTERDINRICEAMKLNISADDVHALA